MHRSLLLVLASLASCAAPIQRDAVYSSFQAVTLVDGLPEALGGAPADPAAPRPEPPPRAPGPPRIAVAPPMIVEWGEARFGRWRSGDRALVDDVARELRAAGTELELALLPQLAVEFEGPTGASDGARESHAPWVVRARRAALRQDFDAVVFVRALEESGGEASLASILDLTLVGAFLVPTHEREALSLMEGLAIGTRDPSVFGSGLAEGFERRSTTLAGTTDAEDEVSEAAHHDALRKLLVDVAGATARRALPTGPEHELAK